MTDVLDPACGSRMFYFDKTDDRVLFGDLRSESHVLCDGRALTIAPTVRMDYRALPFQDEQFRVVIFDPPHLVRVGPRSWTAKKYGSLDKRTWRDDLRAGFAECFRVLDVDGVLIFKWSEVQIPVSQVLALTEHKHTRPGQARRRRHTRARLRHARPARASRHGAREGVDRTNREAAMSNINAMLDQVNALPGRGTADEARRTARNLATTGRRLGATDWQIRDVLAMCGLDDTEPPPPPIVDTKAAPTWRPQCGTAAGYMAHYRAGERYCDSCRAANAAKKATQRVRVHVESRRLG